MNFARDVSSGNVRIAIDALPILLALLIGKKFCIGVKFWHKILAQTWPHVWMTFQIVCVHMMDGYVSKNCMHMKSFLINNCPSTPSV